MPTYARVCWVIPIRRNGIVHNKYLSWIVGILRGKATLNNTKKHIWCNVVFVNLVSHTQVLTYGRACQDSL
jgi:hypothetical protein